MKIDTQTIDRQVKKYQQAKTNRQKEWWFNEIVRVLTNHIRAIKSILLGTKDHSISPKVMRIMLSNMKSTTKIKNTEDFLNYVQQHIKLAGMTNEDVEQTIYLNLLSLIRSYKYHKLSFLHFVTFLLPRRVMQHVWKMTKDQLGQMNTIVDCTENDELIGKLIIEDDSDIASDPFEQYEKIQQQLEREMQYSFIKSKRRRQQ